MSDYPMLISNKLHSFRNFNSQNYEIRSKWRKKKAVGLIRHKSFHNFAQNVNIKTAV